MPNTASDYAEGLACVSIPLVSHEVGQYNVFPNLAELPKYALRLLGLGTAAHSEEIDLVVVGERLEGHVKKGLVRVLD